MLDKRVIAAVIALHVSPSLTFPRLWACTTFCLNTGNRVIFGRNYDFDFGEGLVIVNPRGLTKKGYEQGGPDWTATHGSLTFNQYGREFPTGGINQAGLVVELMWHDRAEYPAADGRAPVGVLEWIQYQLDTASTIEDVRTNDTKVRISGRVPLHYLVVDRTGRSATIEFLGGQLHFRTGETLPVSVLANDTYHDSLAFWRQRGERGAGGGSSHARFSRAAEAVKSFASAPAAEPIARAFEILASVAQRSTRWSIVYDQTQGLARFRTNLHTAIRSIDVSRLDFACSTRSRMMDVNAKVSGDVTDQLEGYVESRNRELIVTSFKSFSGTRNTPPEEIDRIARHPAAAICAR